MRGFRCRSTAVPRGAAWARMSDHLPLVAELELTECRHWRMARRDRDPSATQALRPGHAIELLKGGAALFAALVAGDRRGARRGAARDLHLRVRRRAAATSPRRWSAPRARGVQVRVVVDGIGTDAVPAEWQRALEGGRRAVARLQPGARLAHAAAAALAAPAPQALRRRRHDRASAAASTCSTTTSTRPTARSTQPRFDFAVRVTGPAGRRRARDDDAPLAAPAGRARGAASSISRRPEAVRRPRPRRHRRRRSRDERRRPRAAPPAPTSRALLAGARAARQPALSQAHRALLPLRDRPGARARSSSPTPTSFPASRCSARCCAAADARRQGDAAAAGPLRVLHAAPHQPGDVRRDARAPASRSSSTRRASCMPRWRCSTAPRRAGDGRLVEPRSAQPAAGARGQRLRARRRLRRRAARPPARGRENGGDARR